MQLPELETGGFIVSLTLPLISLSRHPSLHATMRLCLALLNCLAPDSCTASGALSSQAGVEGLAVLNHLPSAERHRR